jgi:hypothetical protein
MRRSVLTVLVLAASIVSGCASMQSVYRHQQTWMLDHIDLEPLRGQTAEETQRTREACKDEATRWTNAPAGRRWDGLMMGMGVHAAWDDCMVQAGYRVLRPAPTISDTPRR